MEGVLGSQVRQIIPIGIRNMAEKNRVKRPSTRRWCDRCLSWLGRSLLCAFPGAAFALDYGYTLEYRGEQSDNIALVHDNPQADWVNTARVRAFLREMASRDVRADVNLDTSYSTYTKSSFADQTNTTLNSSATWFIVPEGFSWTIEDYFGQTYQDLLQPGVPTNRENINVFATGPEAQFRLSPVDSLRLGLGGGNYYAEVADTDSYRYYALGEWKHKLSATTNLSLNYDFARRDFKNQISYQNYDLRDIYFRIESQRTATSNVVLDLGRNRIQPEGGSGIDGNLVRFLYTRQVGAKSNFRLLANSQVTDAAGAVLAAGGVGLVTAPIGNVGDVDVYRIREIDGLFTRSRGFGTDRLRVFAQHVDYYTSLLDQDRAGAQLDVGFGLTDTLTGALVGTYLNTNYLDQGYVDRDGMFGARLQYRVRPQILLTLESRKTNRRSSDPQRSYDEIRNFLTISYQSVALHL
jgi:hypothetical protein